MSKARNLADLISGNSKIEAIEIADGVLTAAKMAANSIDSAQYVDGSIDTAHLSNNISIDTTGSQCFAADGGFVRINQAAHLQFRDSGSYINESSGLCIQTGNASQTSRCFKVNTSGVLRHFIGGDGHATYCCNLTVGGNIEAANFKQAGTNFTNSLLVGHNTTGTLSNASNNTGVGIGTLDAITSGVNNTALGHDALTSNTTGQRNTAIGRSSLQTNTTGTENTAIGYE